MRVAAARTQPGLDTNHAALHRAEPHLVDSHLRPKITEDVYSGSQDKESLWMASAWQGQGNDPAQQQQPSSTAPAASPPQEGNRIATRALESPASLTSGARISIWA